MKSPEPFTSQIREFYGDKKLSPASVERIAALGRGGRKSPLRRYVIAALSAAAVVARHAAAKVISAKNMAVLPGLIDSHAHAGHGLVKTLGSSQP